LPLFFCSLFGSSSFAFLFHFSFCHDPT
jgi:hypothetical protein